MQPLGVLLGSLFVFPWSTLSPFRKNVIVFYSIAVVIGVLIWHFYKRNRKCTVITEQGHLFWLNGKYPKKDNAFDLSLYYLWAVIIIFPFIFWNKSFALILAFLFIPFLGMLYGMYTDSNGSIWCYYTSYSSIIASAFLLLDQLGIYKIVK